MITDSDPTPTGALQKILVTGAGGFVGSVVADTLCRRGFAVRALIRKTRGFLPQKAEIAVGDVSRPDTLADALSGVHAVIHCAGSTRAFSLEDYLRVNRDGTRNILASCARMSSPPRVVCLGSLAAFGPSIDRKPIEEGEPPHPISHYGLSKLEGQRVAENFMKILPVTLLIPPAVYGPGDHDILAYFRLAKAGFLPFPGRGDRLLSLAHVQDVADAAILCLVHPAAAGRSYFVCDGAVHTWVEFADAICACLGKKPFRVTIPAWIARTIAFAGDAVSSITRRPPLLGSQKMRELLQPAWICSSDRIRRELGFVPSYPLQLGIRDTCRWYLAHRWI
jgi:dihydroflavonol-4-reductase